MQHLKSDQVSFPRAENCARMYVHTVARLALHGWSSPSSSAFKLRGENGYVCTAQPGHRCIPRSSRMFSSPSLHYSDLCKHQINVDGSNAKSSFGQHRGAAAGRHHENTLLDSNVTRQQQATQAGCGHRAIIEWRTRCQLCIGSTPLPTHAERR